MSTLRQRTAQLLQANRPEDPAGRIVDSFLIGLTATPAGRTIGFFNQNLVMQYGHDEAVVDGVNVDFDVYRIRTRITEQGATIEAGDTGVYVDKRHKLTRRASQWRASLKSARSRS